MGDERHTVSSNPVTESIRKKLVEFNGDMIKEIEDELIGRLPGIPIGVTLMTFTFNGGVMCYVSNARRKEMVAAMKEFIDRSEKQDGEGAC